jgi:hypothetical protein
MFPHFLAALVAILMADLTDGIVGLFLSTLSIVILGEILPQAEPDRQHYFPNFLNYASGEGKLTPF